MMGCKRKSKAKFKGGNTDKALYQDNPSFCIYFALAALPDEAYALFQELCKACLEGRLPFLRNRPRTLALTDFKQLQGCKEVGRI
jgi:hypothetical protein